MKKLFLVISFIFLGLSSAHANSCAAQATGSYLTAGTWTSCGGTTPGSSDTVTIGSSYVVTCSGTCAAQTVTLNSTANLIIANGGTLTVGASTSGVVLTANSGTDVIVQTGGTLIEGNQPATNQTYLSSGFRINAGGLSEISGLLKMHDNVTLLGQITCHAGGEIESDPVTGGMYVIQAYTTGPPYPLFKSDATAGSHCTVTSTSNTLAQTIALDSYSTVYPIAINATYTDFSNCADQYGDWCINSSPSLILNNDTFTGKGFQWQAQSAGGSNDGFTVNNVNFINMNGSGSYTGTKYAFWVRNNSGTQCPNVSGSAFDCTINNVSIYSATDGSDAVATIEMPGTVLKNSALVTRLDASQASSLTVTNTLFANPDNGSDDLYTNAGGGINISSSAFLYPNCFANTSSKCHGIGEGHNTPGTSVNIYHDSIIDSGGFQSVNNWLLPYGPRQLYDLLFINLGGVIDDSLGTNTEYGSDISHLTSIAAQNSSSYNNGQALEICENCTSAYAMPALHNSLTANALWNITEGSSGQPPQSFATISMNGCTTAIASNVLTVASCTNTMPTSSPFPPITFKGLTAAAWLNGITVTPVTISSTGWTATLGVTTHANYTTLSESSGNAYAGLYYDDNVNYNVLGSAVSSNNIWNSTSGTEGTIHVDPNYTRLTFASNGNSNGTNCGTIQTAGTNSGTIVGDYIGGLGANTAMVSTVSSTTQLLDSNGPSGNPIGAGNCANSQTMTIFKNIWASGSYGDTGKGANEITTINPSLNCPTCNSATWDLNVLGSSGTIGDARDQIFCNISGGINKTGGACTVKPLATVSNLIKYLQTSYQPYNDKILNSAPDGKTYGAVQAYPAAIIN